MSEGPDRSSSSSSALSYLTPPPQLEPPLPEPEIAEPEREIAATHADTVTPPEPAAEVVPEPDAEVIPEPDAEAEAAPEQPEEDSEPRQTWLTAATAGLRTLAEASASLQRELGECRRVDDARHAQCTAQHAAKSAGLHLHAMETEPGGTLLPQLDAGRAAAHEPERDADDHARTGKLNAYAFAFHVPGWSDIG